MPLTLLPMIDPSAEAERNIVHLLLFLPVSRALPLFQSVVVFVVADGVIFHVAIVLSLAAITVVARVVEVEVHGGVGELFRHRIFGNIRYHAAATNVGGVSGDGIGGVSVLPRVPFV